MENKKKEALLFASASANVYNFLGINDTKSHMSIYKDSISNNLKAHEDIRSFQVEKLKIIDPNLILNNLSSRPYIFVSFHTGSYNLLPSWLLKSGHEFYLMADTDSLDIKEYSSSMKSIYREKYHTEGDFKMINVEEEGAIFRIIRKIKDKKITLAFLDGNKGIGGQVKDNKNLMEVDFLQGRVKVRKGLAYMAFLTNTPLVLALNYFKDGQRYLKIYDPIEIIETDRKAYCKRAINQIFEYFEEHVRTYPGQWSNWPYVHRWSNIKHFEEQLSSGHPISTNTIHQRDWKFNKDRFCPLKVKDDHYLFDRIKYHLTSVSPNLMPLFSRKTKVDQQKEIIENMIINNSSTVEKLIANKVLI